MKTQTSLQSYKVWSGPYIFVNKFLSTCIKLHISFFFFFFLFFVLFQSKRTGTFISQRKQSGTSNECPKHMFFVENTENQCGSLLISQATCMYSSPHFCKQDLGYLCHIWQKSHFLVLHTISLTHFRLNKLSPHYILEQPNFNFRYVRLCYLDIPRGKWLNYLQIVETLIPHSTPSDLGLHCLPITLLGSPDWTRAQLFKASLA